MPGQSLNKDEDVRQVHSVSFSIDILRIEGNNKTTKGIQSKNEAKCQEEKDVTR